MYKVGFRPEHFAVTVLVADTVTSTGSLFTEEALLEMARKDPAYFTERDSQGRLVLKVISKSDSKPDSMKKI